MYGNLHIYAQTPWLTRVHELTWTFQCSSFWGRVGDRQTTKNQAKLAMELCWRVQLQVVYLDSKSMQKNDPVLQKQVQFYIFLGSSRIPFFMLRLRKLAFKHKEYTSNHVGSLF